VDFVFFSSLKVNCGRKNVKLGGKMGGGNGLKGCLGISNKKIPF
jgi:peptidyl-tRNA hydrolase